jgi:hypothetical protein
MIQQSPMVQKAIAKLQPELAGKEQESSKPVSIRMLMDAYRCTMVTIAQVSGQEQAAAWMRRALYF